MTKAPRLSGRLRLAAMSWADNNNHVHALRYPWRKTDGGRAKSRRPRQKNDCTVRALALARRIPYDDAYDILKAAGRVSNGGFHFKEWMADQAWASPISFRAGKGRPRMNPATFVAAYREGVFICAVARHVFVVIDGIVYDDYENRPDRCIYLAWRLQS